MQILVVDDQASARRILRSLIKKIQGVHIHEAASVEEAVTIMKEYTIDLALIDIRLGNDPQNRDGHILIKEIKRNHSAVSIVISGLSEMDEIREAMRNGAYDYVIKDALSEEMIIPIIENLHQHRLLESEVQLLRARNVDHDLPGFVPGTSVLMRDLFSLIKKVALSDRPVLVTGPTGSGKELVVKAIHKLGPNPASPLIDINCGAIPENLIESQLFGHKKGAFTGAVDKQEGYLEAVGVGTLFLDEIAELPLALQPGLLRVLESRIYRPIGSTKQNRFQGRIVAATHTDLSKRVMDKSFREDLFYRLNVFVLKVPALNDRREDIPALISHFLQDQPRKLTFTKDAMNLLKQADWPGNVRQLRNVIDRLAVLTDDDPVTVESIRPFIGTSQKSAADVLDSVAGSLLRLEFEEDVDRITMIENALILRAMREVSGNKTAAAKLIGVHRKFIERRQQKLASF